MDSTKNVQPLLNIGQRRYNLKLWKSFVECFDRMPIAAIINNKIFCMHGGLSPELIDTDTIK